MGNKKIIFHVVYFLCVIKVALAQTIISTTLPSTTAIHAKNCTIGGVDLLAIQDGDFFFINQTIFDNINSSVLVPQQGRLDYGYDISSLSVGSNLYVSADASYSYLILRVKPIIEPIEISHAAENFYYNFSLSLNCAGAPLTVYTKIPIHETNTYTPVFTQRVYEYRLFSSQAQDLDRLLELYPIIANDNDISSTEVIFSIEQNNYFDIQYKEVVPNSLNKNHSASLVPKNLNAIISTNALEFKIFVTDLGFPRKSSNATLRIVPPVPEIPTFTQTFYIGDYFLNNSLTIRSQPQLQNAARSYRVSASLRGDLYNDYFGPNIFGNGTVAVVKWNPQSGLPDIAMYKYHYLLYTLSVTYSDPSNANFKSYGNVTVIIEIHPY